MQISVRRSLVLSLAALLLMLLTGAYMQPKAPQRADALLAERDGWRLYAMTAAPEGRKTSFTRAQLYSGLLLYVGADAPLPADLPAQQTRDVRRLVGLYVPAAEQVALSEETIYALCALVRENPLTGTWIMAGMRSPAEQDALQKAAFAQYQAVLPVAEALDRARQTIPDSGKSEHQLSTAFDVRLNGAQAWSQADPMARTADGRWLLENAWRFGFARRYPPDKAELTRACGEELHWRYVGAAHAAALRAADWCLEEYLQALHAYGTLRLVSPAGAETWLLCAPMQEEGGAFSVPEGWQAAVSADNLGYAVCVLTPN